MALIAVPFRLVLCLLNFLFLLVGVILISGVVALIVKEDFIMSEVKEQGKTAEEMFGKQALEDLLKEIKELLGRIRLLLLYFGLIMTSYAIFGIVGNCCNRRLFLKIYLVLTGIALFVHIILLLVYFSDKTKATRFVTNRVKTMVEAYKTVGNQDLNTKVLSMLSMLLQCCGHESGEDFRKSKNFLENEAKPGKIRMQGKEVISEGLQYPIICCKPDAFSQCLSESKGGFTKENSYTEKGCKQAIENKLIPYADKAARYSSFVFFLEVGIIIFTILVLFL